MPIDLSMKRRPMYRSEVVEVGGASMDAANLFRKAFDKLAAGGLLELGKLENSMLALFAFPLAKGIT